jgi:hypothetical protein
LEKQINTRALFGRNIPFWFESPVPTILLLIMTPCLITVAKRKEKKTKLTEQLKLTEPFYFCFELSCRYNIPIAYTMFYHHCGKVKEKNNLGADFKDQFCEVGGM